MVSSERGNNHDGEKVLRKDENRLLSKPAELRTSLCKSLELPEARTFTKRIMRALHRLLTLPVTKSFSG